MQSTTGTPQQSVKRIDKKIKHLPRELIIEQFTVPRTNENISPIIHIPSEVIRNVSSIEGNDKYKFTIAPALPNHSHIKPEKTYGKRSELPGPQPPLGAPGIRSTTPKPP